MKKKNVSVYLSGSVAQARKKLSSKCCKYTFTAYKISSDQFRARVVEGCMVKCCIQHGHVHCKIS